MAKQDKEGQDGLFGGIFGNLEKLINLASELKDMEGKEGQNFAEEKEIDLGHIKQGLKGVYGFSVRTAVGGETKFEPFGNPVKKTEKGTKVAEEREPIVDIFDEGESLLIIFEMPGVAAEEVKATLNGDILEVVAKNKHRNYRKELLLEAEVQPDTLSHEYNNGLLNVKLQKKT